jgi:hypothetical protein
VQNARIPDDVRRFLQDHVDSHEKLSALLLLRRRQERTWTSAEAAAELTIAESGLEQALDELCASGLVSRAAAGQYRYAAAPELDALAASTAQWLQNCPVEMVQLLSENAMQRVRSSAARTFAEAFLLRSKKKNG